MAFDNLNYSTEAKVDEESIQDKIDRKQLEIKQITKANLSKLKVDILHSHSSLKVRDINGKYIGKLKDNQVVDYSGDKKMISYGEGKKLFLGVILKNGKIGYVSADYVKGEITSKTHESPTKIPGKDEVVKPSVKSNPIKKAKDDGEIENNEIDDKNKIENNEIEGVSIEKQINSIGKKYLAFQDTIKSIDTVTDTQTSKEKQENADLLKTNLQSLLKDISNLENTYTLKPNTQNIVNEVKLYLAKYFADEGEIENSNFTDYQLSNRLAFEVLGNIKGVKEAPKAPDRGEVISKIKGTGIGEYITVKINQGEELSKIFSNDTVKGKMEEVGEELVEKYEEDLEVYLEDIDENHSSSLNKSQKQALNLLMDVNGAGWSVKNSTTDMIDVMSWDFASIGAGIGAGFGTGALLGSWTGAGALVTGAAGALVGGATSTLGMMANHGDNYFNSDDYGKGLTEFTINSAMFGAGGAAFKGAKMIQGTNSILSKQGLAAMGVEASADVTIGVMSDMTRGWAYGMNIELTDAITNNLVWALLPIALRGKQVFSAARKKLAKEATDTQQKASILSRLGDKTGAKKLIDGFSNKIEGLRKKETGKVENNQKLNKGNVKNPVIDELNKQTIIIESKDLSAVKKEIRRLEQAKNIAKNKKQNGKIKKINEDLKFWKEEKKIMEDSLNKPKKAETKNNKTKKDKDSNIDTNNNQIDYTQKTVDEIKAIKSNTERIKAAEQILQKYINKNLKLNTLESEAIIKSHNEKKLIGKADLLKKAGFSKKYRRILIESGICGKGKLLDFVKKSESKFTRDLREHFKVENELKIKVGSEEISIKKGTRNHFKYLINGKGKLYTEKELFKVVNKKIDGFHKTPRGKNMESNIQKTVDELKNDTRPISKLFSEKFWKEFEGSLEKHIPDSKRYEAVLFRIKNLTIGRWVSEMHKSAIDGEGAKKLIVLRTFLTGKHSEKIWKDTGGRPEIFSPSTWFPSAWVRKDALVVGGIISGIEMGYNYDDRNGTEHVKESFKNIVTYSHIGILGELLMDASEAGELIGDFLGVAKEGGEMIIDS